LCSSSWALATAGVFTDRFCATTGDTAYRASAQQLLTCEKKQSSGCDRGFILGAMEYGKTKGFVTADCMPYKPYDISVDCNYSEINKCPQKIKVADYCAVEGVDAIKREVLNNGPVASVFPVYRDFLLYRDGVYSPLKSILFVSKNSY
jgi:cathepsin B